MTPIEKKSLKQILGPCDLEIKSIEGGLYVVDILEKHNSEKYFFANQNGSRVLRKNSAELLEELRSLDIDNIRLVQDSAYDEMIGSTSVKEDDGIPIAH